jgi:glucan phosphoethanolaminetransferase (alkaline phosphatase superfamily)
MNYKKLLREFILGVVIWISIPSLFLYVYVHYYSAPLQVVWPHLRLVLLILLNVLLIRIIVSKSISSTLASRIAAAIMVSSSLFGLSLYYGLVLIGLQSWGQVISWDLISSYAGQIQDICQTLEISLLLVIGALVFIYALFLFTAWAYTKHFGSAHIFFQKISKLRFTGIVLVGAVVSISEHYNFYIEPATGHAEPFALTFFPMQASSSFQGHVIDKFSAEKLDQLEDAERLTYKTNAESNRRNLILIIVDALRSDHLGVYEYERNTTPNLQVFEEKGMLRKVEGVRSVCAESTCGLLSIASSKFVHQFSNRPFTLQEVLKLHGYKIHMILGGDHTNFYELKTRYGDVDTYFDGSQASGYYRNDDQFVVEKVKSLPSWDGTPTMMQFHLMSAHTLGKRHEKLTRYLPSGSYVLPKYHNPENIERATNFYDNGVVQSDHVIHELLANLKDRGYLKNSLVVITGDHGEGLGEHGVFGHAKNVYEEAIRIPLIFLSYGYRPKEFNAYRLTASQVDIAPTILEEFGMPRPATWSGIPLQKADARDYAYFQQGNEIGLIDERNSQVLWKYWINLKTRQQYAFNLTKDPSELANSIDLVSISLLQDWKGRLLQMRSVSNGPQ